MGRAAHVQQGTWSRDPKSATIGWSDLKNQNHRCNSLKCWLWQQVQRRHEAFNLQPTVKCKCDIMVQSLINLGIALDLSFGGSSGRPKFTTQVKQIKFVRIIIAAFLKPTCFSGSLVHSPWATNIFTSCQINLQIDKSMSETSDKVLPCTSQNLNLVPRSRLPDHSSFPHGAGIPSFLPGPSEGRG